MRGEVEPTGLRLLGEDPLPWLLASDEPAARWIALTRLLDRSAEDPVVVASRAAVLADAGTADLIGRLTDWEALVPLSGHESAAYTPNLLGLLADMGVDAGDDPRIESVLDSMLRHQDDAGRFGTFVTGRISQTPAWSTLLCDTHAITETLVRYGRSDAPQVHAALERMAADLTETAQGAGWPCLPSLGFRGPGRRGDVCPQVSLEALRTFARLPDDRRPPGLDAAARAALAPWSRRGTEKPYMFGHGLSFKTVKWPPLWYGVLLVLDTIGRYPSLWRGADARAEDGRAVAELAACLIAYNVDADGRVTPRSCYRGFEAFSFGQKKVPSPYATAVVAAVLRPFEDLAAEIARVDITSLASSKGGSGTPMAPRPAGRAR